MTATRAEGDAAAAAATAYVDPAACPSQKTNDEKRRMPLQRPRSL